MKKALCILFAALFVFSVFHMTAFAAPETELVTETKVEPAAADVGNESLVKYSVKHYSTGGILIIIAQGETIQLNYREIGFGGNASVPKGGHIEWRLLKTGGDVSCKVSKDKKTCYVTGVDGGHVTVGAYVYDANGNKLSYAGENLRVRYTGFVEILETVLFGAVGLVQEAFYLFLNVVGANAEVIIG